MRTRRALISTTRREPWRKLQELKSANGPKRASSMRFSKKSACTRNLIRRDAPCAELTGIQKGSMRIYRKRVTPECFNRGSTILTTTLSHVEWVGGPVRGSPGFPLKTCGNDGLLDQRRSGNLFLQENCGGTDPQEIKSNLRRAKIW